MIIGFYNMFFIIIDLVLFYMCYFEELIGFGSRPNCDKRSWWGLVELWRL